MPKVQLHVDTDRDVHIGIAGPLNHSTWAALRRECHELEDVRTVVIDVSGVQSIDSAGIGVLLMIRECAEKKKGRVKIIGAMRNPSVTQVIKLAHLDKIFEIE
ncbi:MAG: STAS protein [Magnetococcales bacterium]|nr:STAS protein [Magnetococcales bacterium]HIJ83862.1 STAS domain-containing protein [Magnetococcales bacterium]